MGGKAINGNIRQELKRRIKIWVNYHNDPAMRNWHFKHAKRLERFKNIHAGESCFIIGNGPSLNKMDLSLLKDYHTFGLNKIYLMFDRVDLNLSYHVAVNRLVIEQSINEFMALQCPSFLSYRAAKHVVEESRDNIYYIATGGPFTFQKEITIPISEGHTVTYVALQIAYYMGFQKIFLVGVDHSFYAEGRPNEKQFMNGDDRNHFDPGYFKGSDWQLPDLEASELAYHMARFHFNRAGRQIYDATVDGKLKVFTKIDYYVALEMCSSKLGESVL